MSETRDITIMIIKGIAATILLVGIYALINGCAAIKNIGGQVTTNNGTTITVTHENPQSQTP